MDHSRREGRGSLEFRPFFTQDGTMTGIGNDPETGVRDGLRHLNRKLDRIEGIAIALNNESAGLNR